MDAKDRKSDPARVSDVPITQKRPLLKTEWLEALLSGSLAAAQCSDLDMAIEAVLDPVARTLPQAGVGVFVPDPRGRQTVVRKGPSLTPAGSSDPARLFPDFAQERVFIISEHRGDTLHFAYGLAGPDSASPSATSDLQELEPLLERLAALLGATIERVRTAQLLDAERDETKRLREQVIQSEKLASLGQIAAGIVHELNNPLTSIVAYSDYLKRKWERESQDASDRERLARINESAERILAFSRDLIDYSRPSPETPAPVSLREIAERALGFCEHVIRSHAISVETQFGETRPVLGVPGQLTQIFVNLVTNACHAMEHGGLLFVAVDADDNVGEVMVRIGDEGHGIDPEHEARIFEPFFTTKTDGTGTGLGLSIVKKIVVAHRGRITTQRRHPRGTEFVLVFPITDR